MSFNIQITERKGEMEKEIIKEIIHENFPELKNMNF